MKTSIIYLYSVIITICLLFTMHKYSVLKTDFHLDEEAIGAVDNYIEKTAGTGEMDDFLGSTEGRYYVNLTK